MNNKDFETTDEEKIYNILIISLIIGVIISSFAVYYFRYHLYADNEYFSELFYTFPDDLPNKIEIGKSYKYLFSIKSDEINKTEYNFTITTELYNLFDYTESKYRCTSKYRDKIYLKWTNVSNNNSVIDYPNKVEGFENLFVYPDYHSIINWSHYTLEWGFPPPYGEGLINIYFRNKTNIRYIILIDGINNTIYFNGLLTYRGINLTKGNNKFIIKATNESIRVILNDINVINQKFNNTLNGQFGFESKNAYFNIQSFIVYRDSSVVVPDDGTIFQYQTDISLLQKKRYELQSKKQKSISLLRIRTTYNESIDCDKEPFYCKFSNLQNDISFFLDNKNISKFAEKVPSNQFNYKYRSNGGEVNWTDFSINLKQSGMNKGLIIIQFSEKWAVMITTNNSYFIKPISNGLLIDEIRNHNQTIEFIKINVSQEFITLQLNNDTIFKKESPEDYTHGELSLYQKNEFYSIFNMDVLKNDPLCKDKYNFKLCEINYLVYRAPVYKQQTYDFSVDYNYHHKKSKTVYASFNETTNITRVNRTVEVNFSFDEIVNKPKNIIDYTINNNFIPDKKIVITSLPLVNSSNSRLDYSYKQLDGARIFGIGLNDLDGTEIASMHVFEKENRILIYHYDGTIQKNISINKFINLSKSHNLRIQSNNDTSFYIDNREVYSLNNTLIKEGYFFIQTLNTYSDIGNVHYQNEGFRTTIQVREEDPCKLKLIDQKIEYGNVTLEPGQQVNITKTLNVNRDFDYGKVSVELFGGTPKNESLEIHYWVKRHDP